MIPARAKAAISYWLLSKPGLICARTKAICLMIARKTCARRIGRVIDPDEFETVLSREGHEPRRSGTAGSPKTALLRAGPRSASHFDTS